MKTVSVKYRKVETDSGKEYYIHVLICLVDDEKPESVGMYKIEIKDADSLDMIAEIG